MDLKGHSKFKLELIKESNGYSVKKIANGTALAIRLILQGGKQITYQKLISSCELKYVFEVPKLLTTKSNTDNAYFIMPFYNGKNILDVLERGDITMLDDLIDKIFMYLDWEFENSVEEFPYETIQGKLINLGVKIAKTDYPIFKNIMIDLMDTVSSSGIREPIPVGMCHGDFTFSNMIFGNKIILIDFLDSFVESPLQDVAKLLQEVRLKWTLLMDNPTDRDLTKINIGYEYLQDKIIDRISKRLPEYERLIGIFYLITLLRIIPYTKKDTRIYRALIKEIKRSQI